MINTSRIPEETLLDLAQTLHKEAIIYFEDPKNNEAFEAWKRSMTNGKEAD